MLTILDDVLPRLKTTKHLWVQRPFKSVARHEEPPVENIRFVNVPKKSGFWRCFLLMDDDDDDKTEEDDRKRWGKGGGLTSMPIARPASGGLESDPHDCSKRL